MAIKLAESVQDYDANPNKTGFGSKKGLEIKFINKSSQ